MAVAEAPPAGRSSTSSASRPRRRPPEVLSEPEAIALIRACSSRAPTGIRNRALIAVLWRWGLRISEALALELRDLDLQAGTLRVRHGKGDKSPHGRRRRADPRCLAPASAVRCGGSLQDRPPTSDRRPGSSARQRVAGGRRPRTRPVHRARLRDRGLLCSHCRRCSLTTARPSRTS
jgi:integrase